MAKSTVLMPYNGERYFWQWDIGRKLIVNDTVCCQVHFCNKTDDCALVCEVYEIDGKRVVDVPNILLQTAHPITAFTYAVGNDGRITTNSILFKVIARNKPDTYVYTETEVESYEILKERLDEIEKNGVSAEQIAIAVEKYLNENPIDTGVDFETDETLILKDGILSVNTTNNMEQDNSLPITSAGVYATVGNIEALLKTI